MKKIFDNNSNLLAIIIPSTYKVDDIEFFTEPDSSQQLGVMNRPKGYNIPAHRHNIKLRHVKLTQEVLFIRSGKIRVDFYDDTETYIKSIILESGDSVLLSSGGHGFEMLEDSDILEVKQGPYIGDEDKVRFINSPNEIIYG